uniref:MADF domain-containing protein n=1 Tax=Bursaphelenchus xylophilus TaxID=6326 RepID=A0A1I7SK80_BURXY
MLILEALQKSENCSKRRKSRSEVPLSRVACEMAAPHARFMKVAEKAHNEKFWIQIERELLAKYPTFKGEQRLRERLQAAFWRVRCTALQKQKKQLELNEYEKITMQVQEPSPDPKTPTPKTVPRRQPARDSSRKSLNLETKIKRSSIQKDGESDDDIIFVESEQPNQSAANEVKENEQNVTFDGRGRKKVRSFLGFGFLR